MNFEKVPTSTQESWRFKPDAQITPEQRVLFEQNLLKQKERGDWVVGREAEMKQLGIDTILSEHDRKSLDESVGYWLPRAGGISRLADLVKLGHPEFINEFKPDYIKEWADVSYTPGDIEKSQKRRGASVASDLVASKLENAVDVMLVGHDPKISEAEWSVVLRELERVRSNPDRDFAVIELANMAYHIKLLGKEPPLTQEDWGEFQRGVDRELKRDNPDTKFLSHVAVLSANKVSVHSERGLVVE